MPTRGIFFLNKGARGCATTLSKNKLYGVIPTDRDNRSNRTGGVYNTAIREEDYERSIRKKE